MVLVIHNGKSITEMLNHGHPPDYHSGYPFTILGIRMPGLPVIICTLHRDIGRAMSFEKKLCEGTQLFFFGEYMPSGFPKVGFRERNFLEK